MKKLLLGAAAAAMTLTGFAANAQTWRGHEQHRDWDRSGSYSSWNGGRYDNSTRYDNRGRYDTGSRWRQGQVYPYYARHDRMISDWRHYNLPAPRAGYGYYRDDNGDVVMAALASGLIGLVIGNSLADHNSYGPSYQGYGYQGYGYQPYGYPY